MSNFASRPIDLSALELPPQVAQLLQIIAQHPDSDTAYLLAQFVASTVHPDYVCNLAMIAALPERFKVATLEFFKACVIDGLSTSQQAFVASVIEPYIARAVGLPEKR